MKMTFLTILTLLCAIASVSHAETKTFDNAADLAGLTIKGAASIDTTKMHSGTGSLKMEKGSKAAWKLRATDGAGKVDIWVYEDAAAPANPKKKGAGAIWGVQQADGQTLAIGAIYASYLAGDTTYASTSYNPGGAPGTPNRPYYSVQHLGTKRTLGWHKWTFDFDPNSGLKVLYDDVNLNERKERIKVNKDGMIKAFTSIVLFGDTTDSGQVLWVDDVSFSMPAAPLTTPVQ